MNFVRYWTLLMAISATARDCNQRILVAQYELAIAKKAVRRTQKYLALAS